MGSGLKWCEMNDHQSIHPRLLRPTPFFKPHVDSLFHSSCVPPLHICARTPLPFTSNQCFESSEHPFSETRLPKSYFVLCCWLDSFTVGFQLVVLYVHSSMPQQVERCWEHIFLFDSSWIFFLAELGCFVGGFGSFVDEVCVLNISRSHHQNNLSNASRWMPAPGVAVMKFLGLWGDNSGGSLVLFVS